MIRFACLASLIAFILSGPLAAELPIARFETQEVARDLTIGYAVAVADINGDGKPDIVVVDKHRVVWYENPTWKMRTILQGKTKADNVCLAVLDIDGDGKLDIVLGAGWAPSDTKNPGTLQWLKRGRSLDDEWTMYPIPCDEPTVHRIRVADLDGSGESQIVVAPLQGRESSAAKNWFNGRPVRILAYKVPKNPTDPKAWKAEIVNESLHVVHNIWPAPDPGGRGMSLLAASYEGVTSITRDNMLRWDARKIGEGNQSKPSGSRGSSEIKQGALAAGSQYIATIEPWHGNQVVVYTTPGFEHKLWRRHVIDDELRWGHAVWCADLDGDGVDELIIGVRDDPNPKAGDMFQRRRGVRIYKCTDDKGEKWRRQIVDNGGVAVEDLVAADLNGDGRIDIIAVGRQTGNLRIYWNKGK